MTARLLINGIDHVERALDFLALEGLGIHPNGEELRAEVAGLDLVEVHVALAGVLQEIEILVYEAAGSVGVGVDYKGRVVDGLPACRNALRASRHAVRLRFFTRRWGCGLGKCDDGQS